MLVGGFAILYGIISVKIKQVWFLGEALPALMIGIVLGPVAAKFIDSERWGSAVKDQTSDITLVTTLIQIVDARANGTKGYDKSRDWNTAGNGRLSVARKISMASMERHGVIAYPCHDNHVAMYHWLHQAHDTEAHNTHSHGQ
jgi:hypothetical protein